MVGNQYAVDNRCIAPYSPFLLKIFDAYINVQFCNSVKYINYICKYVNKGSDAGMFAQEDNRFLPKARKDDNG